MATAWTDEEYAQVATALLYPAYRRAQVTQAWQLDNSFEYALVAKLEAIPAAAKAGVLLLASQIAAKETVLAENGPSVSAEDNIKKVDRIEFFEPHMARREAEKSIDRLRARLSALIDHPVNPNVDLNAGGGVCSAVCG